MGSDPDTPRSTESLWALQTLTLILASHQTQEVKPCEVQPEFDFRFTSELALSFRPDSAPPLTEQQCFSTS